MPPKAPMDSGGGGPSRGNDSILNFFRPVATQRRVASQQEPSQQLHGSRHSPLASPGRAPSPALPSSPPEVSNQLTPSKPQRGEVGASDEEDSDEPYSDDSLEDLSMLLGQAAPGKAQQTPPRAPVLSGSPYATPRAKRTAVEFRSSPLTTAPKHKFDLKALAKDAQLDDETNASSRRVREAAQARAEDEAAAAGKGRLANGDALEGIVKEKSGRDAQKVLRAVQRSETSRSELRYYFFEKEYMPPPPSPSPRKDRKGPWRLLTHGSVQERERYLASGLPRTILCKGGGLPDEIFEWILDDLCIQKSAVICHELANLVGECPSQVESLLTTERLESLFLRLGASKELQERESKLTVSKQDDEPYKDRDWTCFYSFLSLIGRIARDLSVPSVLYSLHTLLRMSYDKLVLCDMDILREHEGTMQQLVDAVPRLSWDSFCFDACLMLHKNTTAQCIRMNALLCLPISNPLIHDLRRRLAVTFLFDDPELGRSASDDVVTLRGFIECLDGKAFTVNSKTDFAEFRASIIILDMAIDDGSVVATENSKTDFNNEVDELALKLREMWRKINDAGMKLARTEAKSVVEWVQQRLSHSVRTQRKVKQSIFDLPGQSEDPFLPRQQDYMKRFLAKKPKSPLVDEDTIVVAQV